MSVTRFRFPNSGTLITHAVPPAPEWTSTIYPNTYALTTSSSATGSNNTNVANGNGVDHTRVRTHSFLSDPWSAAEVVTHVRFQTEAEHWLGGVKAVAVRVRVVDATDAVVADLLPYTLTNATGPSTGGWWYYGLSVDVAPVLVNAGDRLFVEYGGDCEPGSPGQGLYVAVGVAGSDQVYAPGSASSSGRPWIEFTTASAPNPPTGLHSTGATPSSVSIAWTAPAGGAAPTGYDLEVDGVILDAGLVTAYDVGPFLPATTHTIRVRTRAATGVSTWTAPLDVTTLEPLPVDRRWWTHRLAGAVGLDPADVQPVVEVRTWTDAGWTLDAAMSSALQSYQVTYGRRDPTAKTETLTASLVWATDRLEATPAVATRLQVALSPAVCVLLGLDPDDGIRFTGEVTDPTVAHRTRLTAAACAGRLGRGNRMPVDGVTWPVEFDGARAARILAAAGVDLQVGDIDPGTFELAPPTRPETAANLIDAATASSLGMLLEQPSGYLDWHDAEHRRDPVVAVSLAAGNLFRDTTWSQRVGSLVNDLDVTTAAGVLVSVVDTESSDPNRYGPWPGSLDTILTNPLDAYSIGVDIVGRRADPSWLLPDLQVDLMRTIPLDRLAGVLALRCGSLLEVTDLPADFPNDGRMFVEGYVETATPRTWSLALSVSDRLQSGVGIRWVDWPDSDDYQWSDLDPDLSWLDLARIFDPADTL